MSTTFVYNSGEPTESLDTLEVEFGMFFDGTLNNKENTRIREAVLNGKPEKWEKDALKEFGGKDALDKVFGNNANTSYINDYTNVARKWSCCKKSYAIYVEGIGTVDKLGDELEGFMLGSGFTGIRNKVRRGCRKLIEGIIEENQKEDNKRKKLKTITIDVFGFSRGAAAARNFVYEINGNRRAKDDKITFKNLQDGYEEIDVMPSSLNDYSKTKVVPKYRKVYYDKDKEEVDSRYLINGKLPRYGYFGYLLLQNELVSKENINSLKVNIRFIGVYDTVSSYEEVNNSTLKMLAKAAWSQISNQFNDDIEELQLNNLGSYSKAVHFTAKDEHRENFDLTRMILMSGAIEKNFPGVHCDIGGAYLTGTEIVDEIETTNHKTLYQLKERRKLLIDEHWYREEQIDIKNKGGYKLTAGIAYAKLYGKRYLHKEYSYIPLHFMETFFTETLLDKATDIIIQNMELKYQLKTKKLIQLQENKSEDDSKNDKYLLKNKKPVSDELTAAHYNPKSLKPTFMFQVADDKILINSKNYLKKYVFEKGKEWVFINDAKLNQRSEKAKNNPPNKQQEEIAEEPPEVLDENGEKVKVMNIEEVTIIAYKDQILLRNLRHNYLHWSATRDWIGMDPRNNYERVVHKDNNRK